MLFSKKIEDFSVEVKEFKSDVYAEGVATTTEDKSIFNDASKLSKQFQKVKEKIQHIRDPWGFVVYSGTKDKAGKLFYFIGNVVDKLGDNNLDSIVIPAGLYAKITVEKKRFHGWTTRAAKARQFFHCKWIKDSGYKLLDTFQDMDYYDAKSKVSPPSMDIYFPIQKI